MSSNKYLAQVETFRRGIRATRGTIEKKERERERIRRARPHCGKTFLITRLSRIWKTRLDEKEDQTVSLAGRFQILPGIEIIRDLSRQLLLDRRDTRTSSTYVYYLLLTKSILYGYDNSAVLVYHSRERILLELKIVKYGATDNGMSAVKGSCFVLCNLYPECEREKIVRKHFKGMQD